MMSPRRACFAVFPRCLFLIHVWHCSCPSRRAMETTPTHLARRAALRHGGRRYLKRPLKAHELIPVLRELVSERPAAVDRAHRDHDGASMERSHESSSWATGDLWAIVIEAARARLSDHPSAVRRTLRALATWVAPERTALV